MIDQTGEMDSAHRGLHHPAAQRAIAIVDRSADVPAAAKAIASSRCTFQGTSPYAVDVVLVNEWVGKEFLEEFEGEAASLIANSQGIHTSFGKTCYTDQDHKTLRAPELKDDDFEPHELHEFAFPHK